MIEPSVHGNLVVINGRGILLLGKPASGKSTLSYELLKQGHQFVADDLVLLDEQGDFLIGAVKPEGYGLMHLRGQGLIDLKIHFPLNQLLHSHPVHLCYQVSQHADLKFI